MKLSLNSNSKYLRAPSIRQFSNRMNNLDDCVNLTIGQPDFLMPDVVKRHILMLLTMTRHHTLTIKGY